MKKILIIGGTQFVGRAITEKLVRDGRFELHLFNRGKTNPDIFPQVKKFKGDRYTDDIYQIEEEHWDVIIDVTAYHPDALLRTLSAVKDRVKQYILISTMSVYDLEDYEGVVKESHPLLACKQEDRKANDVTTYGARKAACERALRTMADLNFLILRPMLVVGPYDPSDRLYYWLYRAKKYDEILLPEQGQHHMGGWTDVYDFAELVVRSIGRTDLENAYHVPTLARVTIDQVLKEACAQLGRTPRRIAASTEFLQAEGVRPWADLPLWVGGDYFDFDNELLVRDFAIRFSSLEKTIQGCIEYYEKLGWPEPHYGISRAKEEELIKALTGDYTSY
ncbi:MAG: NAD-dependent epimerase/dehydratase family protein [Bacteroidota bacterium]